MNLISLVSKFINVYFRRHIENYVQNNYHISKESKEKNKKTLSDESLKEFNLKKGFECENIVDFLIERHYSTPIDIEKVKATTDIPIHSDNYNLNNCDKFKVIWFLSRKLTDTQKRYSICERELLEVSTIGKKVSIYTDTYNYPVSLRTVYRVDNKYEPFLNKAPSFDYLVSVLNTSQWQQQPHIHE
ncbi:hypothetical protein ACTFIW_008786 [Dictyostelium discoideum]